MKRFHCSTLLMALVMTFGLIAFAACGGEESAPLTPSPAGTATAGAVASPTGSSGVTVTTPTLTGEAVFSREPVEQSGDTAPPHPLLTLVQTGTPEQYDRAIFEFDGGIPGYRVEYVSPPITACGSGLPVEIAGNAFLQVRMYPAAAHDDTGAQTFEQTELAPNLPSLLEMEQICDFEGVVTWVLGLNQEVDFRAFSLTDALLVVDVQHP